MKNTLSVFQIAPFNMKRIGVFILLIYIGQSRLAAQIPDNGPELTIQANSIEVESLLEEITRQSGINFSFNSRNIPLSQVISFTVKNASINETMNALKAKTGIDYREVEGVLVLSTGPKREKRKTYFTISGFITDQVSGEILIGATLALGGTLRGTVTNGYGYYSLPLEAGSHRISISYIGYETRELEISVDRDLRRDIALNLSSVDLPGVTVGLSSKIDYYQKQLEQINLPPDFLTNMPEFAGEAGLIKGLQTLPGIQAHSDASSFFYVRGGERDQNLIIIDEAPIYNPSHLFGLYSIVIPDFTKDITVHKSDMPVHLGDQLSSIVSIRTRDGNLNQFRLAGAFNPLMSRLSVEMPVIKNKGGVFAALRSTNIDWLYKENQPNADLRFGDFNFKWNHRLNKNNRLYFTNIISSDNFTNDLPETNSSAGIRWANFAATLRWNHIFGPKLFSNTTLYTGNYAYRLFFSDNFWQSRLGTLSLKSDFTHYVTPAYKARFGLELQGYFTDPGSFALDSTISILPEIEAKSSRKTSLYYEGEWRMGNRWQLKAGARLVSWTNVGPANYYTFNSDYEPADTIRAGPGIYHSNLRIDPRFSLRYQLDERSYLKASAGTYSQYLSLISNSISPFTSFEVWLPAGPGLPPQSAWQVDIGYQRRFPEEKLEFNAAAYYKHFKRQIDYKDHAVTLLNPLVIGELRFGTMNAYGIEIMAKKETGRLRGWLNYTYSRAFRQTAGLNEGRSYRAFQDRPHDLAATIQYQWTPRILLAANWTAHSGSTFSSPTGFFRFNGQTIPQFQDKNNDRLPPYRRLDIALKFTLNKNLHQRFQHDLTFSIYNALAHKNITSVNFNKSPVPDNRPEVRTNLLLESTLSASQIDLIRFFPSLTYKFQL